MSYNGIRNPNSLWNVKKEIKPVFWVVRHLQKKPSLYIYCHYNKKLQQSVKANDFILRFKQNFSNKKNCNKTITTSPCMVLNLYTHV